jgi:membrane-bound ClpP family serine protease
VSSDQKMTLFRAWLIVMASFLDDVLIFGLIFLGLWLFHVKITWVIFVIVAVIMAGFAIIMHKLVVPALMRRRTTGAEGMIGVTGRVIKSLKPEGTVKIKDEYWNARSIDGDIGVDEKIEVVNISGLTLDVRKKLHD